MNRTDHRGRGFAIFCLWTIVGILLGTGVAYFVYARQAPVFESTATLKIVSAATVARGVVTDAAGVPRQQQDVDANAAATDVNAVVDEEQVSGFRITDDASQDVLLSESTELRESAEPRESAELLNDALVVGADTQGQSELIQQPQKAQSPDDGLLLCSQAVLERAVELGGLSNIQELQWMVSARDQSPEAFVRAWVNDGHMRVEKSGESSLGGVYRLAFRSRLPSTSEKVVQAVAASAVEKFDNGTLEEKQVSLLALMTSGRVEIDAKIQDLDNRLGELPDVADAMLRDGEVVSAAAVRLNAIVDQFERLQLKRDGLKQNIVRAEALLAEGADKRLVLQTLGAPPPQPKLASRSQAQDSGVTQAEAVKSSKAAEEYRLWLEMRNNLIEKVEREVAPMQKKLDALIEKKYGPNHPAVSHLRGQIGRVRAQLANLPPEPGGVGIVLPETNAEAEGAPAANGEDSGGEGSGGVSRTEGMSLVALLKAVRSEVRTVSEEIERLDPELEELSTTVASQDKALRQRESVESEILQQQRLRSAMIKQIESIKLLESSSGISCELLVPASAAVQVEPDLRSHLLAGCMLGGASGAVLFLLILLSVTAVASDGEADG